MFLVKGITLYSGAYKFIYMIDIEYIFNHSENLVTQCFASIRMSN